MTVKTKNMIPVAAIFWRKESCEVSDVTDIFIN